MPTLAQFYQDVLPATGPYCLFLAAQKRHLWVPDSATLVAATERLARAQMQGVYYATAAYQEATRRTQANVRALRALRLDIDAGAEKAQRGDAYPSQRDALIALVAFSRASGLTPTWIISSGAGLHVYYALTQDLPRQQWKPLSRRLAALCEQHGLLADRTVTCDEARILRPPTTVHPSGHTVKALARRGPLYHPGELEALLPATAEATETDDLPAYLQHHTNSDDGAVMHYGPRSALKAANRCRALAHVAARRGDVAEPLWYTMIGLVKHCEEGSDLIHEWSAGHPQYDSAQTDAKIAHWDYGPPTCDAFARHLPDTCAACPHRQKVRSPILLGRLDAEERAVAASSSADAPIDAPATTQPEAAGQGAPEAEAKAANTPRQPWDGLVADGYHLSDTGVSGPVETSRGDTVHLHFCRETFWLGPAAEAQGDDDCAQVILHQWDGARVRTSLMSQTVLASGARLLEYLAGRGIHAGRHKLAPQAMKDYVYESLQKVKSLMNRPKVLDHLGLRILDDGALVAVQGHHVIHGDGRIGTPILAAKLEGIAAAMPLPLPASVNGQWDASVWASHITPLARRHVDFLRRHYGRPGMEKFQMAIALALASPLMAFVTGEFRSGSLLPRMSALTLSLYSRETARGKTTSIEAALAAYGKPGAMMVGATDADSTDLGRMARLPLLGTLPFLMDEMTGRPAAVAKTISSVANGSGRSALRSDGSLRESGTWSLINIITTNCTQREMIQVMQQDSDAIQYRLLEVNMDGIAPFTPEQITTFDREWGAVIGQCAGALGAEIHRRICAMGVEGIINLVTACVGKAAKLLGCSQSARFQYRALGAMLALCVLLKDDDLLPFDIATLAATFKAAFGVSENYIHTAAAVAAGPTRISRMLGDMARHTLITSAITRRGRHSTSFDAILNERNFTTPVFARHVRPEDESQRRYTWVDRRAVRNWCFENGVSMEGLISDAEKLGVLVKPEKYGVDGRSFKFNLLAGTELSTGIYTAVYQFDITALSAIDPDKTRDGL